jgi:hypothetical protein
MRLGIVAVVIPVCLAAAVTSAAAQQGGTFPDDTRPALGVQYSLMGIGEIEGKSLAGFDVNFSTRMLTQPATGIGIRVGLIAEFGMHHYSDYGTQTILQGGVQLRSDKIRSPRIVPSARIMVGMNKFPEGTDFGLTLMPGLEFPLERQRFHLRVEVGQVWDFFEGGSLATWRWGFGIVMPLQ